MGKTKKQFNDNMTMEDLKKYNDFSENIGKDMSDSIILNRIRYFRTYCKREYQDPNVKRVIKKGEKGKYVTADRKVKTWSEIAIIELQEKDFVLEKLQKFQEKNRINNDKFVHSNILDFNAKQKNLTKILEIFKFWERCTIHNEQNKEHKIVASEYNAYLNGSVVIFDIAKEMYDIEGKYISSKKEINQAQLIILWTLLGSILEAIFKIHIVVKRRYYSSFIQTNGMDNLSANKIMLKLEEDNTITENERKFCNQIFYNRNLIHILNNQSPFRYDIYVEYVYFTYQLLLKLYEDEIQYKNE